MPAIGWNIGQAKSAMLRDRQPGDLALVEEDLSLKSRPQMHDRLGQLRLPVAIDPGDADNLSRMYIEAYAADLLLSHIIAHVKPVDAQDSSAALDRNPICTEVYVASHHEAGQLLLSGLLRSNGAHDAAIAHHRDSIRKLQDLLKFVGHNDDRAALVAQATQHREELVLLMRGEDGGGFVEDQQPGVAIEQLENLNPLLHADGQVLHLRVRINGQMVLVAQAAQPPRSLTQVEHWARVFFQTEHGILNHGKAPHQHEFLVHHADAKRDGIFRAGDFDRLAVDQDRSGIHGMESVENLHQGALAGAVLPQQSVDLACFDGQVNIVVGHDSGESLDDLPHRECGQMLLLIERADTSANGGAASCKKNFRKGDGTPGELHLYV